MNTYQLKLSMQRARCMQGSNAVGCSWIYAQGNSAEHQLFSSSWKMTADDVMEKWQRK